VLSLLALGLLQVYVDRRTTGADNPPVGEAAREVAVPVRDARDLDLSIDTNGIKLVYHACVPIDFADKSAVVRFYYPSCCDLVKQYTGSITHAISLSRSRQRTHSTENTFYTHSQTSACLAFAQPTPSIENTFYREHIL